MTPIALKSPGAQVLACGAWLKNTVCLTKGDEAFLSGNIGDLDSRENCAAFEENISDMMSALDIEPGAVACDMHPDFHSSRFASRFAVEKGVPLFRVQHHHAHIAAIQAEHGMEQVLGLALDGVGYGLDGGIWGGELLMVRGPGMERLGHLRELPLPGGDRAARAPWRIAAGVLHLLGRHDEIAARFDEPGAGVVAQMLQRGCPMTSSAGRWFDAASALLGINLNASFEAQAAMELEALARAHGEVEPMIDGYIIEEGVLNFLPLMVRLADIRDAAYGAALFHATFSRGLADWVIQASSETGLTAIALGGGCFQNTVMRTLLVKHLHGFEVSIPNRAPCNDGGVSLGQAQVARALLGS